MEAARTFFSDHWRSGIEILILAVVIYHAYMYFRGTRGANVLSGLLIIFLTLLGISGLLNLVVISWIIKSLTAFLAVALVVIFQPELRRALAALGSHRFLTSMTVNRAVLDELAETVFDLSNRHLGALIGVERDVSLKPVTETGVTLDAEVSRELIVTIFHPRTPLHDGGLILRNDRIAAAGCIFPVSQREALDRNLGLRHRAAIGLTEDSDAVAIIVSEETGHVSVCHRGKLERNLGPSAFRERLAELLSGAESDDATQHSDQPLGGETGVLGGRRDHLGRHPAERGRQADALPDQRP